MEFTIDRNIFLKTLGNASGIIEKKTTLPILSNILIEAKDSKVKVTATDLDIIYYEEITNCTYLISHIRIPIDFRILSLITYTKTRS